MAYTQCKLGVYTYAVNPVKNPMTPVRAVSSSDTLAGRYYTDWGGVGASGASRQEVRQTWPTMDAAMFAALSAQIALGGTLPYIDDDGTHYTVIAMPLQFDNKTAGGDAYQSVSMQIYVVSQP